MSSDLLCCACRACCGMLTGLMVSLNQCETGSDDCVKKEQHACSSASKSVSQSAN